MQERALLTYFRRIYHPCIQQQPAIYAVPCGLVMLWTHAKPSAANPDSREALLGAAVVILTLSDLAEAADAVKALTAEQGALW